MVTGLDAFGFTFLGFFSSRLSTAAWIPSLVTSPASIAFCQAKFLISSVRPTRGLAWASNLSLGPFGPSDFLTSAAAINLRAWRGDDRLGNTRRYR